MNRSASSLITASIVVLGCPGALAQGQPAPQTVQVVLRQAGHMVAPEGSSAPGFDVELMDRFVAWYKHDSGTDLKLVQRRVQTVPELLEAVRSGACPVGVGGITITAEREKSVDFSMPYLPVRMVLVAPKGMLTEDGFRQQLVGKRVGAVTGSTNAREVAGLAKEVRDLRPETDYPTNQSLFAALSSHEVDAVVVDVTQFWVLGKDNIEMVTSLGPAQGLGVVLSKGSPLKAPMDSFLEEFTHSSNYFKLVQRYFGQGAAKMVQLARQ